VFGRAASSIVPADEYAAIVVVSEHSDTFDDLVTAAESSLDFWDNPYDDEDWNGA
jgi:hypothetical protein